MKTRILAAIALSLAFTATTYAADVTSFLIGNGNWSLDANWSNAPALGGFPDNGNDGFTYDVTVGLFPRTVTLDQNITIQKYNQSGATVNGSFNLTHSDQFTWTGGQLAGTGTNFVNAALVINGIVQQTQRTMIPNVSATLSNGQLKMQSGALLSNQVGMTFNILDDSSVIDNSGGFFVNLGTLLKSGAGNNVSGEGTNVSVVTVGLTNSGTVLANAGTLWLACDGRSSGTFATTPSTTIIFGDANSAFHTLNGATLSGAGTIEFIGVNGTLLTNTVNAPGVNIDMISGELGGSGNMVNSGPFFWTGGQLAGTGTNFINGPLSINGIVQQTQRTIIPNVSTTLRNGQLKMQTSALLSNQVGITFNILDDSSVFDNGTGFFVNLGTLLKSGAGNDVSGEGTNISVVTVSLTNSGTVLANAGTLWLACPGRSSGIFTTGPSATIIFGDANSVFHTLNGATLSGSGSIEFIGVNGTLLTNTVNAPVVNIDLISGELGGPGNMINSGPFFWTGGQLAGSGTNFINGPLSINGTVQQTQRTVIPTVSTTLTGGVLDMQSGALISNQVGVTFNIQDDSSLIDNGGGFFVNLGTLLKSGDGNDVSRQGTNISVVSVVLTNAGTVNAQSGTLRFIGGYFQTGGVTEVSGGTITSTTAMNIKGGSLIGTGTVVATVLNNGVLSPGLSAAGSLSINGPLTQQSSAMLLIEIGGYARGTQYDFVNVGGTTTFGGDLALSIINGFGSSMTNGASFTLLTSTASITGAFNNVANGAVLATSDGFAHFTVNYGGSNLVLTGLQIVDSVGDGIPNWWRAQYFGGNGSTTNSQSCAACDADGTGQDNLFKYVAGLDPTNSTSVFVVQAEPVAGQPNQKDILYQPIVSGRTYAVQFATNLTGGVYTPLPGFSGPITNFPQATVIDLSATQTQKFYRIDISLP